MSRLEAVLLAPSVPRQDVETAFAELREGMIRRELSRIPVAKLRETTKGAVRLGAIEKAGYSTVQSIIDVDVSTLMSIQGVGQTSALQVKGAANQVATAITESLKFRVDLEPDNPLSSALLAALSRFDLLSRRVDRLEPSIASFSRGVTADVRAAAPAEGRIRWMFSGRGAKEAAAAASWRLREALASEPGVAFSKEIADLERSVDARPHADEVWRDFEKRSIEYYGLLERLVGFKRDVAATEGYLPGEIVARVNELDLDETFRSVSLRGYQSFGAKFALTQRRVIIGDEMGLGKTVQAIAAMAHLRASTGIHFLVVCPASVLINWLREVRTKSRLAAYQLHGPDRDVNLSRWIERGDIAVTTFETLRALDLPPEFRIAMLVVDEAHYAKNPAAQRSRAVNRTAKRADRVMFLTGTPMENRVEEFRNLVGYLQPEIVPRIQTRDAIAGPDAFRKAVAPVYLRRNQEDVLTELPELVQVDEWEEFGRQDFAAYRHAVRDGNFMAMRRAAFASRDPRHSSKLQRLLDIADEAGDNNHKVIVFSYFRDVLDTIHSALGARSFGPLTGDVPPARRQELVDRFSEAAGHAVLVCQIQAGGVGLDMQAGSVVILCEPQVKPTWETQAIARARRMGQVRRVQVHRLLIADSVDQRMLEILHSKQRLFDEYARKSDVASNSPEALDVSEIELTRTIIEQEQIRLATEEVARSVQ